MRLAEPRASAGLEAIRRPGHRDFGAQVNAIMASQPRRLRAAKPWQAATLPPKLGDIRDFLVDDGSGKYVTISAECQAVDSVAAYWVEEHRPSGQPLLDAARPDLRTASARWPCRGFAPTSAANRT